MASLKIQLVAENTNPVPRLITPPPLRRFRAAGPAQEEAGDPASSSAGEAAGPGEARMRRALEEAQPRNVPALDEAGTEFNSRKENIIGLGR